MTNPPTVQKLTGDDVKTLAWGVVGAAAVAVFVAPMVSKYLGIGPTLALILAGLAVAWFFSGTLRKMGQGAVVFGLGSLAVSYLGPMLQRVNPLSRAGGSDPLFA